MAAKSRTVSLVLGSGGARGLTHVGVIRWLEANDFQIKSIIVQKNTLISPSPTTMRLLAHTTSMFTNKIPNQSS